MRHDDTVKTIVKGGVPLQEIVELEALLQSGGLLAFAEKNCQLTNKNGTYVDTKE